MIVSHLVLGFVTSFLGYLPPSMLNITVSKITIEKNKKEARCFILGVLLIVLFQVFAVLYTYAYIAYKLEHRLIKITKYFNLIIGIITGVIAIYSAVILYL